MSDRPCCLIVDAQPLVRLGMRGLLAEDFELEEAPTCEEALEHVTDIGGVHVAVIDVAISLNGGAPTLTPREAIRRMRRAQPTLGIVAHGARPERHLANAALQAGATTYFSRCSHPDKLREAVRAAVDQKPVTDPALPPKGTRGKLTRRQRQILQLLADGESSGRVATTLGLGEETVNSHAKAILGRLEARNRTQAVAIAIRESLIE